MEKQAFNKIEFRGVSSEDVNRYSKIFQLLITSGALDVKNGTTTLCWADGFLNDVELTTHPYVRDIPPEYRKIKED